MPQPFLRSVADTELIVWDSVSPGALRRGAGYLLKSLDGMQVGPECYTKSVGEAEPGNPELLGSVFSFLNSVERFLYCVCDSSS